MCDRYPAKFFLPPNENAMRAQMGRLQVSGKVDGMIDDEGGSVASGYHNSFRGDMVERYKYAGGESLIRSR